MKFPKSSCVLASLDLRALAVIVRSSHAATEQRSFIAASFFASSTTVFGACCVQVFLRTLSRLSRFQWTSLRIQSFLLLQESYELRIRFSLRSFGTKCFSKVTPLEISLPAINSIFKHLCSFDAGETHTRSIVLVGVSARNVDWIRNSGRNRV